MPTSYPWRTFTPIVAPVSRVRCRAFAAFTFFGGTLWGAGVTLLGYLLGQITFGKAHIELILVGIVALSVFAFIMEVLSARHTGGTPTARDRRRASARRQ
ncbi:hypothetical protein AS200_44575 (plasmid) [Streptomyces sp. CdTB01]|nr:hypothetical protein AS200_44575 [Streptomyces sp. CdTB01]